MLLMPLFFFSCTIYASPGFCLRYFWHLMAQSIEHLFFTMIISKLQFKISKPQ